MRVVISHVEKITLLLLAVPSVLFILTWLKPVLGVVVCIPLIYALYLTIKDKSWQSAETNLSGNLVTTAGIILLLWVGLSGVGGIGFQNYDHLKHNAVVFDLVTKHSPVIYSARPDWGINQGSPLVYYLGYYISAAMLGKICRSVPLANILLFLQTFFVVLSVVIWLLCSIKPFKKRVFTLMAFILFSGADAVTYCVFEGKLPPLGTHFEWHTAMTMQYSSITTQLFYVPQHMSAAWLGALLTLSALRDGSMRRYLVTLCFLPLWSPYVALGLIPFLVFFIIPKKGEKLSGIGFSKLSPFYFLLPLLMILFFYFSSKSPSIIANTAFQTWPKYLLFIAVEIGWLLPFLLWNQNKLVQKERNILFLALAALLIIPFVKMPGARDFIMRASMPSLFILCFYFLIILNRLEMKNILGRAIGVLTLILILVSWITPISELSKSTRNFWIHVPDNEGCDKLFELKPDETALYLGRIDSVFFRRLSQSWEK